MTRHKSFKARVRARMLKTGERYAAARRVLLERARQRSRPWVSEPEVGDEAVRRATGRGWDDWCALIEAWPGHGDGHTAIARYLREEVGVDAWWSQAVTGGYERIVGLRLPGQMPDGSFTVNKSKTVGLAVAVVRDALDDPAGYEDLFPGQGAELRSRPGTKALRIAFEEGVAILRVDAKGDERCRVAIEHQGLADAESVTQWKFFWHEWLEALDQGDE